jgi:hypothetical protein
MIIFQLEEENARLRRRCQERGQRCKALRQEMRQQRDQARRLIVQCALKLDKSQRDIEKVSSFPFMLVIVRKTHVIILY